MQRRICCTMLLWSIHLEHTPVYAPVSHCMLLFPRSMYTGACSCVHTPVHTGVYSLVIQEHTPVYVSASHCMLLCGAYTRSLCYYILKHYIIIYILWGPCLCTQCAGHGRSASLLLCMFLCPIICSCGAYTRSSYNYILLQYIIMYILWNPCLCTRCAGHGRSASLLLCMFLCPIICSCGAYTRSLYYYI
jgi:hypothetical protein